MSILEEGSLRAGAALCELGDSLPAFHPMHAVFIEMEVCQTVFDFVDFAEDRLPGLICTRCSGS